MTIQELLQLIVSTIYENDTNDIGGDELQNVLEQIVNTLNTLKVDVVEGKQLSTEDFTTALKEKLDALPTNSQLSTNLSNKVDKVSGKSLVLNTLIEKLSSMPYISDYNYTEHLITISDGNGHTNVYQLTPYVPIADYYIGWTDGTAENFANLNASQLKNLSESYLISNNPIYTHECINIIFFLMFREDKVPTSGSFKTAGLDPQPITSNDFLNGTDSCQHQPIKLDGYNYKIYAMRSIRLISPENIITVNFN